VWVECASGPREWIDVGVECEVDGWEWMYRWIPHILGIFVRGARWVGG